LRFDGPAGFAQVLAARAAPRGGDRALRIYRRSPNGELIGKQAAPRVRHGARPGVELTIEHLERFDEMDPTRHDVPWAYTLGYAPGVPPGTTVALALDGTVVATAAIGPRLPVRGPLVGFLIPPQLVQRGRNAVTAYVVNGNGLEPIAVIRARG
jgi:hypothetical protein